MRANGQPWSLACLAGAESSLRGQSWLEDVTDSEGSAATTRVEERSKGQVHRINQQTMTKPTKNEWIADSATVIISCDV